MSELPNNWTTARLGDLAEDISYGYTASSTRERIGPHLLRITDIQENEVLWNSVPYCEIDSEQAKKYLLKENDLVFARTGATVGKSFLIKGEIPDAVFASYLIRVRCMRPEAAGYLSLYFRSQDYWQQITEFSAGIGQPNVNGSKLKELVIPLPPLAEQTRIAAKLDELLVQVDSLKARIDGIPALLNRFRQSVLAAAVSGRLTEEWRSKNLGPRETGIQLMAETADRKRDWSESNKSHNEVARVKKRLSEFAKKKLEQIDLPASWCWAELEDVSLLIVDCHNKTAPYEKEGIPLIRTSNIRDGNFQWKDLRYVNEETYKLWSRRCVPEPGDIVFTREAPMGEAAIIPEGKIICLGQRTMLIRCIEKYTSAEFVLLALRDPKFKARSEKLAVGTGVKHYRVGDVSDLLIPVPTKAEQTEIVRRVEQLFIFADQLEARVKAAQTRIDHLTQSILAKAFRGELVPQDPNDEPASVLVDRIKAQRAATPKAMRSRRAATLG
jgi:type I restriction enzyme S subunit